MFTGVGFSPALWKNFQLEVISGETSTWTAFTPPNRLRIYHTIAAYTSNAVAHSISFALEHENSYVARFHNSGDIAIHQYGQPVTVPREYIIAPPGWRINATRSPAGAAATFINIEASFLDLSIGEASLAMGGQLDELFSLARE